MRSLRGRRILLIEDEAMLALMAEDVLLEKGAIVLGPATSVEEAIALLNSAPRPDAAMLDINLGGELSERVATALAGLGVPYLITTGYDVGDLTLLYGNVPKLTKPFEPEELTRALEEICS